MLISPALVACRDSTERLRAMMRCLRVLNALPAATGTDSGFPWDQLNLPAEACIDPFTGQRLRTKRTPQGWIIYSVSANKIDDDGEIRNGGDFGLGPVGSDDAL